MNTTTLFCPTCGTETGTSAFCPKCGTQQPGYRAPMYAGVAAGTAAYAGFWLRFVAFILDRIIIGVVTFPLAMFIGFPFGHLGGWGPGMGHSAMFLPGMFGMIFFGGVTTLAVQWLYFALMESSEKQATVGKMVLSIKVTDLNGNRISFARASGRFFGKILSGLILGIGYIMAGFTERKQALHDMLAETLVVRTV